VSGAPVVLRSYGPTAADQRAATGAHTPMAPRG
jgi:hypothetical protein